MSPVPVCPRCHRSDAVVRRGPESALWFCRRCYLKAWNVDWARELYKLRQALEEWAA